MSVHLFLFSKKETKERKQRKMNQVIHKKESSADIIVYMYLNKLQTAYDV